jgi:type III pantothenate kinase
MLTLDLGNSRAKLRSWELGRAREPVCLAGEDLALADLEHRLACYLRSHPAESVAFCSVAAAELTSRVRSLLAARVARVFEAPEPGLANLCRFPERVGRDRLYAARGALALVGSSCLVLDAGTALTVDALRVDARGGAFLGGAIAPGPALLARALGAGTAQLPRIEPRPGGPALGRDTEEALLSGVVHGFRGAAAGLVLAVAREAGLERATLVLTGGARRFLLEPQPFLERELLVEPELVHRGLIEAAHDAAARAAR